MKQWIISCISILLLLLTACSSNAVSPKEQEKMEKQVIPIHSVAEAVTKSTAAMEEQGSFQVKYTEKSISDEENKKTKYRNHVDKKDDISLAFIDENQYHLYGNIHEVRTTDEQKYPDTKIEIYVKNGFLYKHYFTWNTSEPNRWVRSKATKAALLDALSESPTFLYPANLFANLKSNQNKIKFNQDKDMYVLNLDLTNLKQKATIMGIAKGNKGLVQLDAINKIHHLTVKIWIDKRTLLVQKAEQHEISTMTAENGEVIKKDRLQTHYFRWDKKPITIPKEALTTPYHI